MIREALDKRANQGQGGQGGVMDRLQMAVQQGLQKLGIGSQKNNKEAL